MLTAARDAIRLVFAIAMSKATARAAFLIVPYACVLVGLDIAAHYGSLTNAELPVQFYLASDRGFGEYLEYSMTASVAVMTGLLWFRKRVAVYLANALLFAWLTIDNWTEVHEAFGQSYASALEGIDFIPVEANHLAEAVLFIGIGGFWLVTLALALRSASGRALSFSLLLAGCVVGAAVFGVFVDLLVGWGEQHPVYRTLLVFIEDAGEFAMLILAFLLTVGFFDQEYRTQRATAKKPTGE